MSAHGVVRAARFARSGTTALLRLFSIDSGGKEKLVATSPPLPVAAASTLCRLFDQPFESRPDIQLLNTVFNKPGNTAWASVTAGSAHEAALQAARRHDTQRAKGALIIIWLSAESGIVGSIRAALNVVHAEAADIAAKMFIATYDESLSDQVRVSILLTGM